LKKIAALFAAAFVMTWLAAPLAAKKTETTNVPPDSIAAHQREFEAWRKDRVASLSKPDGWLSLAGLYWLNPGDNKFGSAESNPVRFPDKAPAQMGTFTLDYGKVHVSVLPDAKVTSDGAPVAQMDLISDQDGKPTILQMGSLSWYVIQRGDRFAIRIKDTDSPALQMFKGVPYYPYSEAWRFVATWEPYIPPKQVQVTNIVGQTFDQQCPGAYVFQKNGVTYRLEPTREENQLFLVFSDATTGRDTYGGGRFLYTSIPDMNTHKVVLDFNRAYNPPCAFTAWATCPLPMPQNKLAIRVEAGEKLNPNGVSAPGHSVN